MTKNVTIMELGRKNKWRLTRGKYKKNQKEKKDEK